VKTSSANGLTNLGEKYPKIVFAAKLAVFLIASAYLADYFLSYDIARILLKASIIPLLAGLLLSAAGFFLQVLFLKELSGGKLSFHDSFKVEFYAFLLNMGIASSFFSLPKIALINGKVKNMSDSLKLFAAPLLFGTASRLAVIAFSGAWIYAGKTYALASLAVIAVAFATTLKLPWVRGRLPARLHGKALAILLGIGLLNVVCVCASYYLVLSSVSAAQVRPANAIFCEGVGYIAGLVSPMPSGLGVREFALTELNNVLQVPKDVALAAAVLHRLIIASGPIAVGLAFFAAASVRKDS